MGESETVVEALPAASLHALSEDGISPAKRLKKPVPLKRRNSLPKKGSKEAKAHKATEFAECLACHRQIAPSILAFEEHQFTCSANSSSWAHASRVCRERPAGLVDRAVELQGGLRGMVVGYSEHKFRRWLPTKHLIQFESGRRERVLLEDGTGRVGSTSFRFMNDSEAREMQELQSIRVARELENIRQHAEECIRVEKLRSVEVDRFRRQLEEEKLCPVCLDAEKNTALVPCGHRCCQPCADRVRASTPQHRAECPICRVAIDHVMRVW